MHTFTGAYEYLVSGEVLYVAVLATREDRSNQHATTLTPGEDRYPEEE